MGHKATSDVSTGKFTDANYFAVYNDKEVNIYDGNKAKFILLRKQYYRVFDAPHQNYGKYPSPATSPTKIRKQCCSTAQMTDKA